jgi:hypothetical protein
MTTEEQMERRLQEIWVKLDDHARDLTELKHHDLAEIKVILGQLQNNWKWQSGIAAFLWIALGWIVNHFWPFGSSGN